MNVIETVIIFFAPIALLSWTLRFKKHFTLLSVAPILLLMIGVFALNSDPKIEFIQSNLACPSSGFNATTANSTCAFMHDSVPYAIQPNIMIIVNLTSMLVMFMVIFVVFSRLKGIVDKNKTEQE